MQKAALRCARQSRGSLRLYSSAAGAADGPTSGLQKAQRERALAEALAREEENFLKEARIRNLREKARASVAALNLAPVDAMAQRMQKLQKQLDAMANQKSVRSLDKEIDSYLYQHLRLPESELANMPWANGVSKSASEQTTAMAADTAVSQKIKTTTHSKYTGKFPDLRITPDHKPYSKQELFLRHMHHLKRCGALGSELADVYVPSHDVLKPQSVSEVSIASLMAAGCHLGHAKQVWRSSTQPFIYGEYNGIHLIDLNETLSALKRTAKTVKGVAKKGGVILYIGTSRLQEQRDALEAAAKRSKGYYVATRWIPGTITNFTVVTKQCGGSQRLEVDMGDKNTSRVFTKDENAIIKPDLVVLMNPTENRYCIKECIKLRIPIIGLCDTDMEPSLLTYAIPCNDNSMRANSLVLGCLSKAAEEGVEERRYDFSLYQASKKGSGQPPA